MIIELKKKKINIIPMPVPEQSTHFYIQYMFESGTDHLVPRLSINNLEFIGDRKYINLTDTIETKDVKMTVELLDNNAEVLHRYTLTVPHVHYSTFGILPVRPDFAAHIRYLENRMEQMVIKHEAEKALLRARITELEEMGEVI